MKLSPLSFRPSAREVRFLPRLFWRNRKSIVSQRAKALLSTISAAQRY
jgi:predicted lipoprotein